MDSRYKLTVPKELNGFRFLGEIGRGATGCVCVTRRLSDNLEYCAKIVPKEIISSPDDTTSFIRECETLRSIQHPNVVSFVDFFDDVHNYYLIMEHCKGVMLTSLIAAEAPMNDKVVLTILKQLITALKHLHSIGIAHRDIKPDNIIINRSNNQLKLVDFGFCTNEAGALRETFCGSPAFAPPECITREPYDATYCDIYSSGVVAYMMTTGKIPWKSSNIQQMLSQIVDGKYVLPSFINPQIQSVIKSMMNVNPKERPTAEALLAHPFFRGTAAVVRPRVSVTRKTTSFVRKSAPLGISPINLTSASANTNTNANANTNANTNTNANANTISLNSSDGNAISGFGSTIGLVDQLKSERGSLIITPPRATRKQGFNRNSMQRGFVSKSASAEGVVLQGLMPLNISPISNDT